MKLLGYLVPTIIAAISAGAYLFTQQYFSVQHQEQSRQVKLGQDYYVTVTLLELSALAPSGQAWEYDASAPDIFYEIYWKGNRVFQSSTKADSLVAKWSNAEVNLTKIALDGGKTSLDNLVQAARINIKAEEELELRVYDADLLSNDLAGIQKFQTMTLLNGDTSYDFPNNSLRRVVLRVQDMSELLDVTK